jgi:pimeloyl-ACP methyl ester carboxylesterase
MKYARIGEIDLAYLRRGKGTPLVLLHGYPLDHSIWDKIIPLLEAKFDVVAPDLRGFGASSPVQAVFGMDELATDIRLLLDHLGIQNAVITGHSMGGYVALAFARLHPERLLGLGLVSTQVLADTPDRKEGRYKLAAEVEQKGPAVVVDSMVAKFSSNVAVQGDARRVMERQTSAGIIGALKAMAERQDSTATVTDLGLSVVVVHGTGDALIPVERARELVASAPRAKLVELAGIGHMPMLEAAQETATALGQLA